MCVYIINYSFISLQSLGLEVPLIKTIGESSSSSLLELPHSCSNGTDEELLLPPPGN